MCQSSSALTVPPSTPAQKVLSAARSAASKTTTWKLIFTTSSSRFVGPRDCATQRRMTGPQNLDRMSTIYGPTTWDVYERLDTSLDPRGPELLYDIAAEHITEGD